MFFFLCEGKGGLGRKQPPLVEGGSQGRAEEKKWKVFKLEKNVVSVKNGKSGQASFFSFAKFLPLSPLSASFQHHAMLLLHIRYVFCLKRRPQAKIFNFWNGFLWKNIW